MTRTALPTAVLVALAVVCLPLRADDAAFMRELEMSVQEMNDWVQQLVDRRPSSVMGIDLKRLTAGVGAQLLKENARLSLIKTPVRQRIPLLRQMYLQQMRKIHDIPSDGNSIVKYNERDQSLTHRYVEIHPNGRSVSGTSGPFASKLVRLLKIYETQYNDPFARGLKTALQKMRRSWETFQRSETPTSVPILYTSSAMGIPPHSPLAAVYASISPMEFPNGLATVIEDINYELTKLDVELAEQDTALNQRAEKLRERFIEILQRANKLAPIVELDEYALMFLFYDAAGAPLLDGSGAHLAFQFPLELVSVFNQRAKKPPGPFLLVGAAAVALLFVGGVYLLEKLTAGKEDENE